MRLLKSVIAILLSAPVFGADGSIHSQTGLVAHEWGTFTTVAGANGEAVPWIPLSGASDLPCFVHRLGNYNFKMTLNLVRMETPVIYFYTNRKMAVTAHADFPMGLITEWYPEAVANAHNPGIEWKVEVTPGATPELPVSKSASHYFAARETDAAPVLAGKEPEKMLFYRGVASFQVPLKPVFQGDGRLLLQNMRQDAIPFALVFENRGGKIGYRVVRALSGSAPVDMPELRAQAADAKSELAAALTAAGLYPKEAAAMIATWSDSWFEEGMRVFYIVPRSFVDAMLPLKMTPAPDAVQRTFVGRIEVLPEYMKEDLTAAMNSTDTKTLDKLGRFLQPFAAMLPKPPAKTQAYLNAKLAATVQERDHPTCGN